MTVINENTKTAGGWIINYSEEVEKKFRNEYFKMEFLCNGTY